MKFFSCLRILLPSARRLRLTTYFICVCLAASLFAARALRAYATEAAYAFGRELSGLADLTGGAEGIVANGHRFRHASTLAPDAITAVLDRLEAHCRKNPALLASTLAELAHTDPRAMREAGLPGSLRHGVIREDGAERGMLVCFIDRRAGTLDDLLELARDSIGIADLTNFGALLYAYAERQGDQTHVVTLWTETGLDLPHMFPESGDAAGDDSRALPRPPQARRILSATADGMPFALRLYETAGEATGIATFYDEWMKTHDFQRIANPDAEDTTAYLRSDGYQAFITIAEAEGVRVVSATEAGRSDGPSITTVEVKEQP